MLAHATAYALPQAAPAEDLEMDQLTQILIQCHLHEEEVCGAAAPAEPTVAAPPDLTGVDSWANQLVQQLQCCASVEQGRALCAEALLAFRQHQAGSCCSAATCPYGGRLEKLQGANKVIIRALRALSQRHVASQARVRQVEEANAHLAEQLRQCQEQLQASERAKANLQSHLQMMNSNLSESVMNSHHAGPSH
jgi:hypothetical protein